MRRRPRRNHSAAFKGKVAIDPLADGKTIAEIAQMHDVHPSQVTEWRRQLVGRAAGAFGDTVTPEAPPVEINALHVRIVQLSSGARPRPATPPSPPLIFDWATGRVVAISQGALVDVVKQISY